MYSRGFTQNVESRGRKRLSIAVSCVALSIKKADQPSPHKTEPRPHVRFWLCELKPLLSERRLKWKSFFPLCMYLPCNAFFFGRYFIESYQIKVYSTFICCVIFGHSPPRYLVVGFWHHVFIVPCLIPIVWYHGWRKLATLVVSVRWIKLWPTYLAGWRWTIVV